MSKNQTLAQGPLRDVLETIQNNGDQKATFLVKAHHKLGNKRALLRDMHYFWQSDVPNFLSNFVEKRRAQNDVESSPRQELVSLQEALSDYGAALYRTGLSKPQRVHKKKMMRAFCDGLSDMIMAEPNIIICAADELPQCLAENPDVAAVLSIEHPGSDERSGAAPRLKKMPQKILTFWDVENNKIPQGPSAALANEAYDFLNQYKDQKVIIHCRAGKSRSVGLALPWVARERGIDKAIAWMKGHREKSAPNILMVHHGDFALGLAGHLEMAVLKDQEWAQRRQKLRSRMRKEHGPDIW